MNKQINPGNWQGFSHFFPGSPLQGKGDTHHLWYYGTNLEATLSASNGAAMERLRDERGIPAEDFDVNASAQSGMRGVKVYGALVRVRNDDGTETEAARLLAEIQDRLDAYPILDEEDYSDRVYDGCFNLLVEELYIHRLDWDYEAERIEDVAVQMAEYWGNLGDDAMRYDDWCPDFGEGGDAYEALMALGYAEVEGE